MTSTRILRQREGMRFAPGSGAVRNADAPHIMSKSPKIIPFRILLRLVPRAAALLGRIIAARAAKLKAAAPARSATA